MSGAVARLTAPLPHINCNTPIDELPSMLSVPEVAAWARISRGLVYKEIQSGALRSVKFGRIVRVPKTVLEAWLAATTNGHT